jgi:beta-mannosidase
VLHYVAKDIYSNVIISPFHNATTSDFEVYVTSDLWSSASGTATFTWYDWSGNTLNTSATPNAVQVNVGAINTTRVFSGNTHDILTTLGLAGADVVLAMDVAVQGTPPNSNRTQAFTHRNWFHPVSLSQANLVDPRIMITYEKDSYKFVLEATNGVAAWVWIDYPAGAVVTFEKNGFWLGKGAKQRIGFDVKSDNTGGKWIEGVTVRSLWDNTTP